MRPTTTKKALTAQDIADLERIESELEEDQKSFFRFAKNLKEIKDRELYRRDYRTFEAYCQLRWGWTKQWVYQQLKSYSAIEEIPMSPGTMVDENGCIHPEKSTMVDECGNLHPEKSTMVPTERAARALSKVPKEQRAQVLQNIEAKNTPVTGKTIAESAKEIASLIAQGNPRGNGKGVPKPPPYVDGTGYPVPERYIPIFKSGAQIEALLTKLSDVRGYLYPRVSNPDADLRFVETSAGGILASIDSAYGELKRVIPYSMCADCQGLNPESCRTCKGRGYVSKFFWDHCVPMEAKQIRQKANELRK